MVFEYIPYTFWDLIKVPLVVFVVFVVLYAIVAVPFTIKLHKAGELRKHGESFYSLHAITVVALTVFIVGLTTGGSYIFHNFNQNREAVQAGVNSFYGLDITDEQATALIGSNAYQLDRADDNVAFLGSALVSVPNGKVENVKLVRVGNIFKLVYNIKSSTLRELNFD